MKDEVVIYLNNVYPEAGIEKMKKIVADFFKFNNENDGWTEMRSWMAVAKGFYRKVKDRPEYAVTAAADAPVAEETEVVVVCRHCWKGGLKNSTEDFCVCDVPAEQLVAHREYLKEYDKPKSVAMDEFCAGLKTKAAKRKKI
jgi:hypothetical protein